MKEREEAKNLTLELAMEAADYDLVVDVENPRQKTARKVLRDSENGLTGCPECMEDWNT